MEKCYEWEIEVDQNKQQCNLHAQEEFIVSFVGALYRDIDSPDGNLSRMSSLHFTRIFSPDRDSMGAYVRLRVFADEDDLPPIQAEIDTRLRANANGVPIFQVKGNPYDWDRLGDEYGGPSMAPTFRDFLASTSKICYELLVRKQEGAQVETVLWPWTHFFFNMIRGYGCSVVEFAQGAVTGFIPNV